MKFFNEGSKDGLTRLSQISVVALLLLSVSVARSEPPDVFRKSFPKIAGTHIGGSLKFGDPAVRERLSKHHIAIYGFWPDYVTKDTSSGQNLSMADIVSDIRQRAAQNGNPDILITKYTNITESYSPDSSNLSRLDVAEKLNSETGPYGNWWARDDKGEYASTYPGNWITNITRFTTPDANGDRFPEWVTRREHNIFFASGVFDGQFNDIFSYRPTANLDWDGDGNLDSRDDETVRRWYREGHADGLDEVARLRPDSFVIGNVISHPNSNWGMLSEAEYKGRIVGFAESAAGLSYSPETYGGWSTLMKLYRTLLANSLHNAAILNIHGDADDYQLVRYGLASALLDNGYFSYSSGYSNVVWYDEFDVVLGLAIDPPQTSPWKQGVYMRRFENGMAIVNPKGNGTQTISIPSGYKRIAGVQDPGTNNGQIASTVQLADRDGIILLATSVTEAKTPKPPTWN